MEDNNGVDVAVDLAVEQLKNFADTEFTDAMFKEAIENAENYKDTHPKNQSAQS